MMRFMSFARVACIGAALLALTSCSNLDDTQQKMLSGGAAGAVIGTVGIAMTGGCIPCGTAIGGVVGAGTGYVMDYLGKNTRSEPSSGVSYNNSYNAPLNPSAGAPPVTYSSNESYSPASGSSTYGR